jgi:hypothetical protein
MFSHFKREKKLLESVKIYNERILRQTYNLSRTKTWQHSLFGAFKNNIFFFIFCFLYPLVSTAAPHIGGADSY